jgi:hypothetical protein
VLGLAAAGTLAWVGRSLVDSVLDRLEWLAAVHPDRSRAAAGVERETEPLVFLAYRTADGHEVRALVGEERLAELTRSRVQWLEGQRQALRAEAHARTAEALVPVFGPMRSRVDEFADWYLGWGTGYRMLALAATSAASHALAPEVLSLSDAVALDLERSVERNYRDQVLRPEESDPALRQAYAETLRAVHARVLALVRELDEAFQSYLAEESRLLDGRWAVARARLELDWNAQTRKLALPDPGAAAIEPLRGVALTAGGALAGRAVGAAAGRALAEGIAARSLAPAGVRVAAQLARPVAARVVGGLAGASAGAAGGPVGLALGGALGLGVDYLVHSAGARLQRPELERTVSEALTAHAANWQAVLGDSAVEALDVWLDDLSSHLVAHAR